MTIMTGITMISLGFHDEEKIKIMMMTVVFVVVVVVVWIKRKFMVGRMNGICERTALSISSSASTFSFLPSI